MEPPNIPAADADALDDADALGPAIGTRLPITVLRRGALVDVIAVPEP
ncbi:hypothetical protein HC028_10295 [Planosporangium flavigriseum]|uniref:Uncharacterized protein n=1 Tax=Planosporangium flavigriseum TaxID=373681 RepID=A0A8J3PMC3_9ACTN|nr:hypothetical protein [Planosporangium flavigriseum]NJC64889.1 hypothetical protein [Planosporangium flavigriseum]GIG72761.1 hypothetical protein Pfl04_11650 [Planosporangium flavigriseum]